MDKTSKKVTKDPKCVDAARKGREKYMNKLKESILNDAKKGGGDTTNASNETSNASIETTSATNNVTTHATSTTTTNDTYVHGVGMLAVLAIGACVFFAYQAKNKKQDTDPLRDQHEQKKGQPPKRRLCSSKIYTVNG